MMKKSTEFEIADCDLYLDESTPVCRFIKRSKDVFLGSELIVQEKDSGQLKCLQCCARLDGVVGAGAHLKEVGHQTGYLAKHYPRVLEAINSHKSDGKKSKEVVFAQAVEEVCRVHEKRLPRMHMKGYGRLELVERTPSPSSPPPPQLQFQRGSNVVSVEKPPTVPSTVDKGNRAPPNSKKSNKVQCDNHVNVPVASRVEPERPLEDTREQGRRYASFVDNDWEMRNRKNPKKRSMTSSSTWDSSPVLGRLTVGYSESARKEKEMEIINRRLPNFLHKNMDVGYYSSRDQLEIALEQGRAALSSTDQSAYVSASAVGYVTIRANEETLGVSFYPDEWSASVLRKLQDKFNLEMKHIHWLIHALTDAKVPLHRPVVMRDLLPLENDTEAAVLEEMVGKVLKPGSVNSRSDFAFIGYVEKSLQNAVENLDEVAMDVCQDELNSTASSSSLGGLETGQTTVDDHDYLQKTLAALLGGSSGLDLVPSNQELAGSGQAIEIQPCTEHQITGNLPIVIGDNMQPFYNSFSSQVSGNENFPISNWSQSQPQQVPGSSNQSAPLGYHVLFADWWKSQKQSDRAISNQSATAKSRARNILKRRVQAKDSSRSKLRERSRDRGRSKGSGRLKDRGRSNDRDRSKKTSYSRKSHAREIDDSSSTEDTRHDKSSRSMGAARSTGINVSKGSKVQTSRVSSFSNEAPSDGSVPSTVSIPKLVFSAEFVIIRRLLLSQQQQSGTHNVELIKLCQQAFDRSASLEKEKLFAHMCRINGVSMENLPASSLTGKNNQLEVTPDNDDAFFKNLSSEVAKLKVQRSCQNQKLSTTQIGLDHRLESLNNSPAISSVGPQICPAGSALHLGTASGHSPMFVGSGVAQTSTMNLPKPVQNSAPPMRKPHRLGPPAVASQSPGIVGGLHVPLLLKSWSLAGPRPLLLESCSTLAGPAKKIPKVAEQETVPGNESIETLACAIPPMPPNQTAKCKYLVMSGIVDILSSLLSAEQSELNWPSVSQLGSNSTNADLNAREGLKKEINEIFADKSLAGPYKSRELDSNEDSASKPDTGCRTDEYENSTTRELPKLSGIMDGLGPNLGNGTEVGGIRWFQTDTNVEIRLPLLVQEQDIRVDLSDNSHLKVCGVSALIDGLLENAVTDLTWYMENSATLYISLTKVDQTAKYWSRLLRSHPKMNVGNFHRVTTSEIEDPVYINNLMLLAPIRARNLLLKLATKTQQTQATCRALLKFMRDEERTSVIRMPALINLRNQLRVCARGRVAASASVVSQEEAVRLSQAIISNLSRFRNKMRAYHSEEIMPCWATSGVVTGKALVKHCKTHHPENPLYKSLTSTPGAGRRIDRLVALVPEALELFYDVMTSERFRGFDTAVEHVTKCLLRLEEFLSLCSDDALPLLMPNKQKNPNPGPKFIEPVKRELMIVVSQINPKHNTAYSRMFDGVTTVKELLAIGQKITGSSDTSHNKVCRSITTTTNAEQVFQSLVDHVPGSLKLLCRLMGARNPRCGTLKKFKFCLLQLHNACYSWMATPHTGSPPVSEKAQSPGIGEANQLHDANELNSSRLNFKKAGIPPLLDLPTPKAKPNLEIGRNVFPKISGDLLTFLRSEVIAILRKMNSKLAPRFRSPKLDFKNVATVPELIKLAKKYNCGNTLGQPIYSKLISIVNVELVLQTMTDQVPGSFEHLREILGTRCNLSMKSIKLLKSYLMKLFLHCKEKGIEVRKDDPRLTVGQNALITCSKASIDLTPRHKVDTQSTAPANANDMDDIEIDIQSTANANAAKMGDIVCYDISSDSDENDESTNATETDDIVSHGVASDNGEIDENDHDCGKEQNGESTCVSSSIDKLRKDIRRDLEHFCECANVAHGRGSFGIKQKFLPPPGVTTVEQLMKSGLSCSRTCGPDSSLRPAASNAFRNIFSTWPDGLCALQRFVDEYPDAFEQLCPVMALEILPITSDRSRLFKNSLAEWYSNIDDAKQPPRDRTSKNLERKRSPSRSDTIPPDCGPILSEIRKILKEILPDGGKSAENYFCQLNIFYGPKVEDIINVLVAKAVSAEDRSTETNPLTNIIYHLTDPRDCLMRMAVEDIGVFRLMASALKDCPTRSLVTPELSKLDSALIRLAEQLKLYEDAELPGAAPNSSEGISGKGHIAVSKEKPTPRFSGANSTDQVGTGSSIVISGSRFIPPLLSISSIPPPIPISSIPPLFPTSSSRLVGVIDGGTKEESCGPPAPLLPPSSLVLRGHRITGSNASQPATSSDCDASACALVLDETYSMNGTDRLPSRAASVDCSAADIPLSVPNLLRHAMASVDSPAAGDAKGQQMLKWLISTAKSAMCNSSGSTSDRSTPPAFHQFLGHRVLSEGTNNSAMGFFGAPVTRNHWNCLVDDMSSREEITDPDGIPCEDPCPYRVLQILYHMWDERDYTDYKQLLFTQSDFTNGVVELLLKESKKFLLKRYREVDISGGNPADLTWPLIDTLVRLQQDLWHYLREPEVRKQFNDLIEPPVSMVEYVALLAVTVQRVVELQAHLLLVELPHLIRQVNADFWMCIRPDWFLKFSTERLRVQKDRSGPDYVKILKRTPFYRYRAYRDVVAQVLRDPNQAISSQQRAELQSVIQDFSAFESGRTLFFRNLTELVDQARLSWQPRTLDQAAIMQQGALEMKHLSKKWTRFVAKTDSQFLDYLSSSSSNSDSIKSGFVTSLRMALDRIPSRRIRHCVSEHWYNRCFDSKHPFTSWSIDKQSLESENVNIREILELDHWGKDPENSGQNLWVTYRGPDETRLTIEREMEAERLAAA